MLIIEDGSIVAGADSLASVTEFRAYAAKRGATVPAADAECEILLIKGMEYVATFETRLKGCRVSGVQMLPFPRYGLRLNGFPFPSNAIPDQAKNAQMQAAIEAQLGDLMPNRLPGDRGAVTKRKIGTLETEYAEPQQGVTTPRFAKVDGLLAALCDGSANSIRLVRA